MNITIEQALEVSTPIDVHVGEGDDYIAKLHRGAAERIGHTSVESLVMQPDVSLVTPDIIAQERAAGHDMSGIYKGGHR